jgi:phosphate acyltransferase
LRQTQLASLDYYGFVEGDDLGKGTVDVVVTEGFAGNIALKTAEGTAKQVAQYLREAISDSWLSRLGYLLARPAFARLKTKLDPRNVNGGVFLGLDGVVIKSHGGSDAIGTARAIETGYAMVRHELLHKIREALAVSHEEEPLPNSLSDEAACDVPPAASMEASGR